MWSDQDGWGRHREDRVDRAHASTSRTYSAGTTAHGFVVQSGYPLLGSFDPGYTHLQSRDHSTPGYRRIIDRGGILNHAFWKLSDNVEHSLPASFDSEWEHNDPYTCNQHTPSQQHHSIGKETGTWRPAAPLWLNVDALVGEMKARVINDATISAHARVSVSEMQALATLGEARESINSMVSISTRVLKIARNVRALNLKALRREFSKKELADRYMEARYALRPLVIDAAQVCNYFDSKSGYLRKTFRAQAAESQQVYDTTPDTNPIFGFIGPVTRTCNIEVSAHAGVLCDIHATAAIQAGLDRPLEAAWELVPFSFIVDWFANVGDIIAAHAPKAGIRQLASWTTVKTSVIHEYTMGPWNSDFGSWDVHANVSSLPSFSGRRELLELHRIPDPHLGWWPSVRLNLDTYKLTDLGVILRNVFH